jgi:hypothetical protein
MATVVHEASSSTVSENFPPAVLVIFRSSLGLRDNGTETGTPGTRSTDFFFSIIDRVRAGTGGGCRIGVDIIPTRFGGSFGRQQQQQIGQPILQSEKKRFLRLKNNPKCICETTIATNMSSESSLMKIPFF